MFYDCQKQAILDPSRRISDSRRVAHLISCNSGTANYLAIEFMKDNKHIVHLSGINLPKGAKVASNVKAKQKTIIIPYDFSTSLYEFFGNQIIQLNSIDLTNDLSFIRGTLDERVNKVFRCLKPNGQKSKDDEVISPSSWAQSTFSRLSLNIPPSNLKSLDTRTLLKTNTVITQPSTYDQLKELIKLACYIYQNDYIFIPNTYSQIAGNLIEAISYLDSETMSPDENENASILPINSTSINMTAQRREQLKLTILTVMLLCVKNHLKKCGSSRFLGALEQLVVPSTNDLATNFSSEITRFETYLTTCQPSSVSGLYVATPDDNPVDQLIESLLTTGLPQIKSAVNFFEEL